MTDNFNNRLIPPPPPEKQSRSRLLILAPVMAVIALVLSGISLALVTRPAPDSTQPPPPAVNTDLLTQSAVQLNQTVIAAIATGIEQRFSKSATQTASIPAPTLTLTPTHTPPPTVTLVIESPTFAPTAVHDLVISPLSGAEKRFAYPGSITGLSLGVYSLNRSDAQTVLLSASYGGFVQLTPGIHHDAACSLEIQNPYTARFDTQPIEVIYCAPDNRTLTNPVFITAQDNQGRVGTTQIDLRRDVISGYLRQIATALETPACPYESPGETVIPLEIRLQTLEKTGLPRSYHAELVPSGSFQVYNPADGCRPVRPESLFVPVDHALIAYYVPPADATAPLPEVSLIAAADTPVITESASIQLQPVMIARLNEQIPVLSAPDTTSAPLNLPLMGDARRIRQGQGLIIVGQQNEWLIVETNQGNGYVRPFASLVKVIGLPDFASD